MKIRRHFRLSPFLNQALNSYAEERNLSYTDALQDCIRGWTNIVKGNIGETKDLASVRMSQKKVMRLTAKESKVRGSGTVRLPESAFEVLQIKRGESVVIFSGEKSRIVRAYGSKLVEDGVIYLRRPEMEALEVQVGDVICVDRLKPVSKIVKEKTKPVAKKIKKGVRSIKERLTRKEEKREE